MKKKVRLLKDLAALKEFVKPSGALYQVKTIVGNEDPSEAFACLKDLFGLDADLDTWLTQEQEGKLKELYIFRHKEKAQKEFATTSPRRQLVVALGVAEGTKYSMSPASDDLSEVIYLTKDLPSSCRVLRYGREHLETRLTDGEAAEVCSKMISAVARAAATQYRSNRRDDGLLFTLHKYAANAVERYGSKFVAFILSLPSLRFGSHQALPISSRGSVQYQSSDIDFPSVTFRAKKDVLTLTFHPRETRPSRITIRSRMAKREIGSITTLGAFVRDETVDSRFSLFLDGFSFENHILSHRAGVSSGVCNNTSCHKPLSDPLSLWRGYGPCCWKNLQRGY